jgi:hypothetical protein
MKFKVITTWMCMIALLCISSYGYGAVPVGITPNGITFPDNSVQATAAVLPTCTSGEVIVNNTGSWLCGSILPVDRGIATCVNTVCAISACQPTWGNCDGVVANGCEASLATTQNCGTCGNVCAANSICSAGTCVVSPNSPLSLTVSGAPAAGFINNQRPVVVTANVQQVAGGPVPAGTLVNFAITGGSGSLSSPTAVTDASGNASVTLNSSAEGNVSVTATAAPATNSAVISFTNPNKPGSIALAANPVSGVANNATPVTMTATVSPADLVNGTIANGTVVAFTIVSGSGSLSTATAATTNGVASVTLNSASAGSVGVSASAGTSPVVTSTTVTVPFITQPTLAIVKVATTGTLPGGTLIGGINATVTANPSTGLSIAAAAGGNSTDVSASGVGVGSTIISNTNNVASVVLSLLNLGGIPVGEFETLTYHIAPGTFPTAGNFSIALSGAGIIDALGVNIPGIGVTIQSVTIQ